MKIEDQFKKIKDQDLAPLYLVQGDDQYLLDQVKKSLSQALLDQDEASMNFGQFNMMADSLDMALSDAESYPFFGDKRLVYIQDPFFLTGEKRKTDLDHDLDRLLAYLQNPADFTVLVFFAPYEKLDKRKKVTKALLQEAEIIDASSPDQRDLKDMVQKKVKARGYQFDKGALKALVEKTNANLSRVMQELDKLFLYHLDDKIITVQSVDQVVSPSLESNVFSINDYILSGQSQAAIRAFNDLIQQKEEPIKIIAIMMNQFRLLLQVKILRTKGYQQGEIAKILKVHPYRVKLAIEKQEIFSKQSLSTAYRYLIESDHLIKTGKVNSQLQFELFALQFKDSVMN